jgi:hypothetical protein
VNSRDDELSACLSGLVDVGVGQAELELEAEFPGRVVEPLGCVTPTRLAIAAVVVPW